MTAIESLLAELIDYAGLYPPAALDIHTAVRHYLDSARGPHRRALGRFVIDLERFPYLWDAAGGSMQGMRLAVLIAPNADWDDLRRLVDKGYRIEAVEVVAGPPAEIERLASRVPPGVTAYFEIPVSATPPLPVLDAIAGSGVRVKLRMGGLAGEAFPSPQAVAETLAEIANRRLLFKATAGLHHPVRGRYPLAGSPTASPTASTTASPHSPSSVMPSAIMPTAVMPTAVMHGFVNLASAAALLYFGGEAAEARQVLEEEWPGAWQVRPDAILWGENGWNADELHEVRQNFMAAIGSCSFAEPLHELEALGWY